MPRTRKANAPRTAASAEPAASRRRLNFDTDTTFLIVALANKLSASATQTYMRHFGVGVMEWRVLAMVAVYPGVNAKRISEVSGVDKSSISRAANTLVRRGYLVATEDHSDNRRSLHVLTKAGYALHNRIYGATIARTRRLLTGFSDREQQQLQKYLHRLTANLPLVSEYAPGGQQPPRATQAPAPRRPRKI
jgi:DNA-binding MarR family transcriptional regulator